MAAIRRSFVPVRIRRDTKARYCAVAGFIQVQVKRRTGNAQQQARVARNRAWAAISAVGSCWCRTRARRPWNCASTVTIVVAITSGALLAKQATTSGYPR